MGKTCQLGACVGEGFLAGKGHMFGGGTLLVMES